MTYDLGGIENMNSPDLTLTHGNLIQKTPRAKPVRKGTEPERVPGGREEAATSQNHMQAKVMRKQKL